MLSYREHRKPLWLQLKEDGRTSPDDLLTVLGIRMPSIDPAYVARRLGVRIEREFGTQYSGCIDSSRREATIFINAAEPLVRQRFTIAHELGHLMLHPLGEEFRETTFSGSKDWKERQANGFAAGLLMPEWMLDLAIQSTGGEISRLARLFGVSEQAMQYRLENTGR